MANKDYFGFLHSPNKYAPSYEESIRDMEADSFGDLENTKDSPFHSREIYNAMDSFSRTQDLRNKYNFLEKYFEEDDKPFTSLTEQEIAQVSTLLGSDITQPAQIRQLATLAQKDKKEKDKNRPDGLEDYLVTGGKAGVDTIARGVAKLPGQIAGIFGRSSTLHKENVINAREEQEANPDKVVYDPSFGIGSFNREDKTIAEKAGEIGEDVNEKIDEKFNESFLRVKPGENELSAMIGGGAGSLVASLVATAATKKPTYVAAAFGIQQASDTMIRAEDAGKSVEQAYLTGIGAGFTEAALEKVGLDLFFKNPATSFIKATALKSITEGTQEGLQSLSSNAWNNINDKNQGFLDGVVESALLGGLLGGVAGAPMTLAQQQKVTTEGLKLGMTKDQVAGFLDSVIPKLSDKINAGFKAVTGQEILQGNRYSRYVTQEELTQIDEKGYLEVGSDGIINPNKAEQVKGLNKKHLFKLEFTPDIREMVTEEGKIHSQVAVDQIPVEYISKTVSPKQQAVDAKQLEQSTETAEVSEEIAESTEAEGTSVLAFKGADGQRYTTTITQAEQEYLNNETANIPSGDQNTPQLHLDAKTAQQSKSGAKNISRDEFIKMHPQAGGVLKSATESKPKVAEKKQPTFKGGKPMFKQKQAATEESAAPEVAAKSQKKAEPDTKEESSTTDDTTVAAEPKKPKTTTKSTIGTPKLAQGVKSKAMKNKLIHGFDQSFNSLPDYDKVDVKVQQEKAAELTLNDPEGAFKIAMGQEQPPNGVLPESVFIAVENMAIANRDVETLRALATQSGLTSEATGMGQRIRMLAERNADTPVGAIQSVERAREKSAKKRGLKSIKRSRKVEVAKIKSEIKKKNTVKKQTLQDFINGLEC